MPPTTVTVFAAPAGTFILEDDGIFGDNFSRVRLPNGITSTFEHPTNELIFDPGVTGTVLTIDLADPLGTTGDLVLFDGRSLTSPNAGRSTACP